MSRPTGWLRRLSGTTAAVLVLLAGCTGLVEAPEQAGSSTAVPGDPSSSAAAPGTSEGTTQPTPDQAQTPEPPAVGDCYRLDWAEATAPTSTQDPVPCRARHTAVTYHVGSLDLVVDGHLLAVDSARAQRQVQRTCLRRLGRYVGGDAQTRALSRLHAVWFSPTLADSDRGAAWFRCDVVALAGSQQLASLPPGRLQGFLDRPRSLDRVGLCATAAPGSRRFERVVCARSHSWRALATISLSRGPDYPGVSVVRRAGEERCREMVRERTGSPERFRYGWEWPTRQQWRDGRHYGFCWAPD